MVVAGIVTALAGIAEHVVVTGFIHAVNDLLGLLTGQVLLLHDSDNAVLK